MSNGAPMHHVALGPTLLAIWVGMTSYEYELLIEAKIGNAANVIQPHLPVFIFDNNFVSLHYTNIGRFKLSYWLSFLPTYCANHI